MNIGKIQWVKVTPTIVAFWWDWKIKELWNNHIVFFEFINFTISGSYYGFTWR